MLNHNGFLRKTHNCIHLLINTHYYVFRCCFLLKKTAGGRTAEGLAQGFLSWYWRHPITLRSLVVRSTDVGPNICPKSLQVVDMCLWDHLGCVWEVSGGPFLVNSPLHISLVTIPRTSQG